MLASFLKNLELVLANQSGRKLAVGEEISFYIHVPFCQSRCGYCDFNTYVPSELSNDIISNWLAAIKQEIKLASKILGHRIISTIFFGGGTPSFVGAKPLVEIVNFLRANFSFSKNIEITTESNPESVDSTFFMELYAANFNRISLGMQSVNPRLLKILDREHTAGRAISAVKEAQAVGFKNINLDVIYGIPTETTAELTDTLYQVIETGIPHISLYSLIVEPGTAMYRKVAKHIYEPISEDSLAERYALIDKVLNENGYKWYEISNWAKSDHYVCQHNLKYWGNQNWWGLGPGAHSHVEGLRWWNEKLPIKYTTSLLQRKLLPVAGYELLKPQQQILEERMLKVRTKFGLEDNNIPPNTIRQLLEEGLVELKNNRIILTLSGRLLGDLVVRRLVE